MAGHRMAKGRPTQAQAHDIRSGRKLAERLTVSVSPEQRLTLTFDAFRSAVRNSPARGPRAIEQAQQELARLLAWVTSGGDAA